MGLILSYAALVSLQCLQRCQLRYSRRTEFSKVQTIVIMSEFELTVKDPEWRRTPPLQEKARLIKNIFYPSAILTLHLYLSLRIQMINRKIHFKFHCDENSQLQNESNWPRMPK